MNTEGFSILSAPHITVLVIIAIASIVAALIYRKLSVAMQDAVGLCLGIIIAVTDISHYIIYYFLGELSVFAIPLHLCAMAVYVCLLHSIIRADWMGQVLYALCLPGVWCALIFPDWTRFPFFSYQSLDSFIIHGLISAYITAQLISGRITPRLKAIWKPVVFLGITAPIAAIANRFLGTNFMFISRASQGSPLEWLASLTGESHALYLILYGLLVLIVMTLLYLPFEIRRFKD